MPSQHQRSAAYWRERKICDICHNELIYRDVRFKVHEGKLYMVHRDCAWRINKFEKPVQTSFHLPEGY